MTRVSMLLAIAFFVSTTVLAVIDLCDHRGDIAVLLVGVGLLVM